MLVVAYGVSSLDQNVPQPLQTWSRCRHRQIVAQQRNSSDTFRRRNWFISSFSQYGSDDCKISNKEWISLFMNSLLKTLLLSNPSLAQENNFVYHYIKYE